MPPLVLRTLLVEKPWNAPLHDGTIASDLLRLDFDPVEEASKRFKAFVREGAYDCGELAVATLLQAKAAGKPLVLLPVVVSGNFQHGAIGYNSARGEMAPSDLAGKRVGVRSYAQTTCLWARGILQNEYGVDPAGITWVTMTDGHVAEVPDPPTCERVPKGKVLPQMLLDGEIDAAILGSKMPDDPRLKSVIPEPAEAARRWSAAHGDVRPINHMFVVGKSLCETRPDVVRALYDMLVAAWATTQSPFPTGLDGDWAALDLASQYAVQQQIVPRRFSVDELFEDFAKLAAR